MLRFGFVRASMAIPGAASLTWASAGAPKPATKAKSRFLVFIERLLSRVWASPARVTPCIRELLPFAPHRRGPEIPYILLIQPRPVNTQSARRYRRTKCDLR